jgi:2-polyprenyl-6-methoxyphenol hydroxylase-like FAD-dependent oxidoreductase
MAKTIQQVIIVGGGIGGLCTAIALRQIGIDVRVYEQTEAFERVGAGLAVWANAIRALRQLGMADGVIEAGCSVQRMDVGTASGKKVQVRRPGELEQRLGESSIAIHRAELHRVLVSALPAESLRLGMKCVGFEQDTDKVMIRFNNGQTDQADLLIGADGLHSIIRQQLFPETRLNYAGRTSWRGVAETKDVAALSNASQIIGCGNRFGITPIHSSQVYWFAVVNIPAGQGRPGTDRKEFLMRRFQGWPHPVEHLIDVTAAQTIVETPIYDIEPLARWSQGRVTLLGDAAHAATPDMGQGACMAIEDAVVMARCLSQEKDLAAALDRYEAERKPRTTWIIHRSRAIGRFAHWENPLLCTIRELMIGVIAPRVIRQFEKAMDYDV